MSLKSNLNLACSLFQQNPLLSLPLSLYFICVAVPCAVLEVNGPECQVLQLPMYKEKTLQVKRACIVSGGLSSLGFETIIFITQKKMVLFHILLLIFVGT